MTHLQEATKLNGKYAIGSELRHGNNKTPDIKKPSSRKYVLWGFISGCAVAIIAVVAVMMMNKEPNIVPVSNHTFTVEGVSFTMVGVEGGTFTMGATSEQGSDAYDYEKPAHQVTLSSYSIGETEVTQALWKAVMGENPSNFKGDNKPVECVSWDDCQTFIKNLNELTGEAFRMPTEAEWEFACRGGNKSKGYKYSGSNNINDVAWSANSYDKGKESPDYSTYNVATKQPNELGIYDMSGNVREWCQDWADDYSNTAQTDPKGPFYGSVRVLRGGSWNDYSGSCRSSFRHDSDPNYNSYGSGLRLALSVY